MKKQIYYQYYVEGENEKYLVNVLKTELRCILPGKVDKFNVVQDKLTTARIRILKPNTVIVLIFDTDVEKTDILLENIRLLEKQKAVKEVICIPQAKNLEDELFRSCDIKQIKQLTHSCSKKDFKRDLLNCTNLGARLKKCGFSIEKLWSRQSAGAFRSDGIWNDAAKIKI